MNLLGFDIGGANTKAALVNFNNREIEAAFSYIEYFPFWEKKIEDISHMLNKVKDQLLSKNQFLIENIDFICITITAELSDAFQTKREGIITILNALCQIFNKEKMRFISNTGLFLGFEDSFNDPISIAGANWVSTALFLGNYIPKAILIDAGSTTIDIIPILGSKPITKGKTDVERIIHHELIYTGGLRATIPSITHFVPYKGYLIRISFEKFALISDVHRVLENITETEYINDTADNRSKSLEDCYARLARVICMDIESISKQDLREIAKYIYEKQLELIESELKIFMQRLIEDLPEFQSNPLFIITGLSAEFLIRPVLAGLDYLNVKSYEEITNTSERISSSAFAVAGAYYYELLKD